MHRVKFTRSFAAAHRVWNDPGKCRNIHGHNYRAVITLEAEQLDGCNFIAPFDAVKRIVDEFDHALILDVNDPMWDAVAGLDVAVAAVPGVPSTEFLAAVIAGRIAQATGALVEVVLRETDGIEATGWA